MCGQQNMFANNDFVTCSSLPVFYDAILSNTCEVRQQRFYKSTPLRLASLQGKASASRTVLENIAMNSVNSWSLRFLTSFQSEAAKLALSIALVNWL